LARYRLRFLLQEIDVHRGVTLIGRSPDCQVTIEDPLVSRQHARIVIDEAGARVEDLKSRNGVKVNGAAIRGEQSIKDGDRLRIGTQELVFCEIAEGSGPIAAKTTGFLRHCARCRMPYPQEMLACPSCGETLQLEEDTMTGQLGDGTSRSWGLQLLLEVLDKALALGRVPDAARALQRIQSQVEERLAGGERLEPKQLDEVARSACTVANATRDAAPVAWVMRIYPRANLVPGASVIEAIGQVAVTMRSTMRPAVTDLMEWVRVATDPNAKRSLEQVVAAMEAAEARGDPDQTTRNPVLS
jgi:pSer/pThr/pTyr-binding forkhead associated (FHA) protein